MPARARRGCGQYVTSRPCRCTSPLLVGLVDTFGKVLIPQTAGILVYVLMAAILLWRPEGLFRAG